MTIKYSVFWLGKQREIYGDDFYFVLGDLMASFDTYEDAIKYMEDLELSQITICTIIKTFKGDN